MLALLTACASAPVATGVPLPPTAPPLNATELAGYPAPATAAPTPAAGDLPSGYPGVPTLSSAAADALHTPVPPEAAPAPAEGKASLAGVLYSYSVHQVVPKTMFYLTLAVGDDKHMVPPMLIGPVASAGDLVGYTNEMGQLAMNDVPPGNYYLIVSTSLDWRPGQINSQDDAGPVFIELKPGDQTMLGVVYVDWP